MNRIYVTTNALLVMETSVTGADPGWGGGGGGRARARENALF